MLSNKAFFVFVVTTMLVSCSDSKQHTFATACSSISETDKGLLVHNKYYEHLESGLVLTITREELIGDSLAIPKTLIAPVYPKKDSAAWEVMFQAHEFEILNDLLISETINSEKDASYKIFNLLNGKEVITYTYDKFDILFSDENEKRFLGFYGKNASDIKTSRLDFKPLTFGYLSFSNKDGILGQIRIDTKDEMWHDVLDISNPVIELLPINDNALSLNSGKTLYFTGADGKEANDVNFDIQITFYTTDTYKPMSFMIQIRNDKFDLTKDFSNTVFHLESL